MIRKPSIFETFLPIEQVGADVATDMVIAKKMYPLSKGNIKQHFEKRKGPEPRNVEM